LRTHLEEALNNSYTVDEIREVLLHTGVDAFRVTSEPIGFSVVKRYAARRIVAVSCRTTSTSYSAKFRRGNDDS
jgi:hypothetical protein